MDGYNNLSNYQPLIKQRMINLTEPGADWLQPVGTDCTACDGSQKQQLSLRSKILTLHEAITSFNKRKRGCKGCLGVQKALFFAKCIEGIKAELTTYEANLEKRVFEELFSPDFFEILRDAKWLKDQKLEKVLFKMKDIALVNFDIPEEVDVPTSGEIQSAASDKISHSRVC